MKEAIGGTWLIQIVMIFIFLFTGFMCLSINRSKAFNVKDQMIQTIQSYNGIDLSSSYQEGSTGALADIVSYITNNSYRTTGVMPDSEEDGFIYHCFTRDGKETSEKPVFCIAEVSVKNDANGDFASVELPEMVYYHVVVFYQLDIPVLHDLFNFKVEGDTKVLYGGAK